MEELNMVVVLVVILVEEMERNEGGGLEVEGMDELVMMW